MTRISVALYPRKKGGSNPFLANLSRAFESQDVEVTHWLTSTLFRKEPEALIINWAENLWDETQCTGASLLIKRLKRGIVNLSLNYHRARKTRIIFIAHNLFPHGSIQGRSFWLHAGSQLVQKIDGIVHFSYASKGFFQTLSRKISLHVTTPFPVTVEEKSEHPGREPEQVTKLVLVGANQARKNLLPLLLTEFDVLGLPIYTTGYKSRKDFVRKARVSAGLINSNVRWLGERISAVSLDRLLGPGSAVVLNQQDQLNSSLLWHSVRRGAIVIAPHSEINEEIQAEVGSELLRLFHPPLNPEDLASLLDTAPKSTEFDLAGHGFSRLVETILSLIENKSPPHSC